MIILQGSSKLCKQDNEELRKYEEEKKLLSAMPGKILPLTNQQITIPALKKSVLTSGKLTVNDGNSGRSRKSFALTDTMSKST